ncbi:MAG TPA: DnaB-like helicase C-terminal domain-containing protein [Nocardioidaceae bacterium]|nr:DnaB-like helicase C-terminal domain-containing protein [Nocardioidaceae bacterium]
MDLSLQNLNDTLEQADYRVKAGAHSASRVWPTGFTPLDEHLSGGFRSGDLILLGGAQGLGKTTLMMQIARNIARAGRAVLVFSYEHDQQASLIRLVALEAGMVGGAEAPSVQRIRQSFEATDGMGHGLAERLSDTDGGAEAIEIVREYAERLVVHRSTGSSTGLEVINETIQKVRADTGQPPMVVVDYLQKVPTPGDKLDENDRITKVVEGLKDLALDHDIPIVAVVASDKEGIGGGKRMRINHFRGTSALGYEADTILVLNNKADIVARHHLVYNLQNVDEYQRWAVMSIEKNRNGLAGIDMEFRKMFEQSRYDTNGRLTTEQLLDERVFTE